METEFECCGKTATTQPSFIRFMALWMSFNCLLLCLPSLSHTVSLCLSVTICVCLCVSLSVSLSLINNFWDWLRRVRHSKFRLSSVKSFRTTTDRCSSPWVLALRQTWRPFFIIARSINCDVLTGYNCQKDLMQWVRFRRHFGANRY